MLGSAAGMTVNGIDVGGLQAMAAAIGEDPSRGRTGFRVKTDWAGQTCSETTVETCTVGGSPVARGFTIRTDEPNELLGGNSAPNPQELLMAAVNACMVVHYVAQASVRGIALDSCRIETEGEIDLRGCLGTDETIPPGFRRINYTVFLEGDGTREQFEELHDAVTSASPNFFNLAQPTQMCGRLA